MSNRYRNGPLVRAVRLTALLLLLLPLVGRAQFTVNNPVVLRIGDGTTTLSAAAAPVSLLEYSSTGMLVGTPVALNSGATGVRLTITGNSSTEGALFRTADGLQLATAGYNAAAATTTVTGTGNGRSVATIDANRVATILAAPASLSSNGNHRSVAFSGTDFYSATSSGGVQYYPSGGTTATQLSTVPTNVRVAGIYGGQLYITSMSGSNVGLNTVGTGIPTTSGQTTTLIAQPGASTSSSPYGFVLLDQSATESGFDVAYIADERGSATGGVYKFSKVSGTWTQNGLVSSALGVRYLAARLTAIGVELYAATSTALYTFSDNSGYNTAPTVIFPATSIATAGTNYAFRGVAFAPVASFTPSLSITKGATPYPSAGTAYDFGNQAVATTSPDVAFTLSATAGGGNVTITSITPSNSEFAVSGTAPASITAGGLATLNLAFTPSAASTRSGSVSIAYTNSSGSGTYMLNLTGNGTTAANPVPTITSLAPNSATAGAAAQTLTVNGTNFIATSSATFNGTARTTTFISATQLTINLTTADLATAGAYNVTVTNPAPGGGTTAPVTFTVNPVPAPTLTAISPSNPAGGATYVFTITGADFSTSANTTVNFNGAVVVPTSVNGAGTSLTVSLVLPAAGGTLPMTVTTPNGTSGPLSLTITPAPAGFFEPFEPGSLGSYPVAATPATVTLRSGSYVFVQSLIGSLPPPGDKFNNTQSARIRGGGSVTMGFDKPTGAGVVTLSAALYGNDTGPSLTLEYSTNGGSSYVAALGSPAALTGTLTPYTFTLNVAGNVRLRIGTTNATVGANPRLNVDDLQISDYTAPVCNAPTTLAASGVTSNAATVSFTGSASAVNGYTVTTVPVTTTQTLGAAATSVSFTGLTPGTAYMVNIVSNCAAGATSSAASVSFTTLAAAPALTVRQGTTPIANGANPSYSFGNQTTGTTQSATFTLTNTGPDPLTISGISATNPATFTFNTLPLPATVAANGGTVSLTVIYNVGTGPETGTIGITSDAANGNASFQLNLRGTGVPVAANPLIAVTQAGTAIPNGGTYSGFSSPVSTASSSVTFTISNPSTTDALSLGTFVLTGPFFLSGTQPATVAPGGTADFGLTFLPTASGIATGSVSIPNNSQSNNPYLINLSGQGTPADLVVSNAQNVSGTYNNVTVTSAGIATLTGVLTVNGTLTVAGVLSGNCQSVTTNTKTVNGPGSFVLQAGGRLDICDAAGITASGASGLIQVAGTRSYSPDATYAYLGGLAQLTGNGLPSQARAVVVNNTNGLTLSQAAAVTQTLALTSGNLNTGGKTFTLLSSASGTAGVVNTGGAVVGTATVQRYINSSNALGYRHYSAPVNNTTLADLSAPGFTPTFNTAYNGSATPGTVTSFPTVFGYDQSRIATAISNFSAFDKGWFSPGATDPMLVAVGYAVNAPNTALIDFVGTLNNGLISTGTLSRGSDPSAGWHLMGNPYPSPIDWSTITVSQRPGMDAAVYVFESAGQYGGSYRTNVNGVGGNGNVSPLIVSGSGCFVRVSTPNGTGAVNLNNSNRVTTFGVQPNFGRGTADPRPQVALTLQGASVSDDAYVYFQAGATAGKDGEFDATKLANPHGLNLTSLAGGEALGINGLPVLGSVTVLVPLNVVAPQAGSYSLTAGALANFTGTTVTLLDALASTRTVLTAGTSYAFNLTSTSATGRFALEFRPSGALATTAAQALSAQTQLFPNPASGSFRVQLPLLADKITVQATLANTLGQTVLSRTLRAPAGQGIDATFDVRDLAAGVYTLRLNADGTPVVRKVIVE